MEDDDEFGDLYTDLVLPFQSSAPAAAAAAAHPPQPPALHRPIDLNLKSSDNHALGAPGAANSSVPHRISNHDVVADPPDRGGDAGNSNLGSRVLDGGGVKLEGKDGDLMDKDMKFDIEDGNDGIGGIGDVDSGPIIPGLSTGGSGGGNLRNDDDFGGGEGDDWDSDSDDDLQIVLNDNNHGPMGMERGGIEDDDEDGEPLVIVGDGDGNQAMEEQDWGEDASQAADGERKEMGEAGKANGGMVIAPKVGYSSHGYHPFHSQFKYVRPGAAPIPGSNLPLPGGVPGQVRPPINIGPIPGRGRGDWRPPGIRNGPPMQKVFHSGFGAPAWGAGRGTGGGLEFTLPSHKSIFDVDIDSFEEKPWKYPGIDISDYFNFGLIEETWKDYCKQLEQLRLESTMQSKIRVYESGRTEQEYDPDLPPELAAATGAHDAAAENVNIGKSDLGQNDLAKGSSRMRPPLPTGRAIQVETGYGERLPSIDTRPPRIRDSDAIIEIVCQDSMDDDSSTGNGMQDQPDNDPSREEGHEAEEDNAQVENEYDFPPTYNGRKREPAGKRMPFRNASRDNMPEGDDALPFLPDPPPRGHPGSRGQTPVYSDGNFGSSHEERRIQGRARDRSPHTTQDKKFVDNQKEESVESMDSKRTSLLSSPVAGEIARESSIDHKDAILDDTAPVDGNSEVNKESLDTRNINDTFKDGNSLRKQKLTSRVEPLLQEPDDGEDSKAARSSDNSKARSGSSRDIDKWRDGADEEVLQDGRGMHMGGSKKQHMDENEKSFRRKDVDGRQGAERIRMVGKGREDPYSHRDWDPSLGNHLHVKSEGFDRRRERESADGAWQRRDDDHNSRRVRAEDVRKRERGEEMGSRQRGKVRESERSDKDDHLQSRKQLDNGSYRAPYDKDVVSRHRERDDNLKSKYENADEYHNKRRKDDEYLRREHDKEEILQGHRENSSRRKRERDDVVDQRKRDDQPRIRDTFDDHHSVRHKDESWVSRERTERPREREDLHRQKQSHVENLSKRERDEGRSTSRSGRGAEEKAWVGHARAKDEYKGSDKEQQLKDTARHSEQLKRRERIEDENLSHHRGREDVHVRGNQLINEERRSRQERSSSRNDRAVHVSDNQRVHERKNKENVRKNKEFEGGDQKTSKRYQEDQSRHVNETGMKGIGERNGEQDILPRHSSRKHKEDAASSDEEHQDSRRGRSKLERWTSHKERDFSINSKSSSSLKLKEFDANNTGGSSETTKLPDISAKTVVAAENQHTSAEDASEHETKDADKKPLDDKHLDTVEKLKKRSERFKLPMPIEKETSTIKRLESEALPSTKSEAPAPTVADSEIKPERPARKRRWISQ